jgi:hypothetical protein
MKNVLLALAALVLVVSQPCDAQELPPPEVAPVTSTTDPDDTLRFTAWPLFYRERRPGYDETSVLLFRSIETEEGSEVDVYPFLCFERQGSTTTKAVRPFYFSKDDPETETGYRHLLPFWVSWWDADSTTLIALPGAVYARRGERHMFHLWPLFGTHDLEGGGSRVFGPAHGFWLDLDRSEGTGGFAAPFPLVFADWSPEEATTVAAPLLFARRRSGDSSWWVSAPFAFSSESPETSRLWTIPYAYTRDAEETRHDVLFPLFTRAASHDGTRSETTFRPLFWYDRNPERTWSLTVPLYYYESGAERSRLYTLLYQRDSTPTRTWSLSAPFFYRYSSEDESRFWTIPYAYTRDAERTRHDLLFPLFTRSDSHDGTRSETSFRPLFWHDRSPERTWSLAVPFYYYESSEAHSRFYTLLYQRDATPERSESLSIPFFYTYSSEEESRVWTIPYAYTRDAEETRHDVLFPLFTRAASHDGERSLTAFRPLFWHERSPERTWSLGVPFYYYESSAKQGRLYTPLFQIDQTPERTAAFSLPFFYRYTSEEESRFWTLPYAYTRDAEETRHDVLFPLFTRSDSHDGESSHTAFRPLFWHDRSPHRTWSLGVPFYYYESSKNESRFYTLLYQRNRNRERTWSLSFPFFYSYSTEEEERFYTFPYTYTRDAEETRHDVLFPFFTRMDSHDGTRSETALRPLFWHERSPERTWSLGVPFYYYESSAERGRLYTPLFQIDQTPERTATFSLPFFYRYTSEEESRFWTIPYAYTRDAERTRHDVLFPLFTRADSHDGKSSETALRPLFWHERTPEETESFAFPFYYYLSSAEHGRLYTPLFQIDQTPERTATFSLPFFYRYTSEEESRFWTIPYAYTRDAEQTRHDVLFPLFTRADGHQGESSLTALRPLFWHERTPERTWSLTFPLYYYESSEEESRFWTIPYAYTRDSEETRHDVLFPLFTRAASHDGTRSETSLRPLFWYDRSPERTWSLTLPLYFGSWSKERDLFVSPLYLHYRSAANEFEVTSLLPLYWQGRSGETSVRTLFPLYWEVENEAQREHTFHVFPLYSRFREGDYTQSSLLWPLTAYGSGGGRTHARFLPLFLYDETEADEEAGLEADWRLDLLYPLLHFGGGGQRSEFSLLFGLANYDADAEDHDFRILGYWYRNRSQEGRRQHYWLPFYYSSAEAEEREFWILYPLFEYERSGASGQVDLLWKTFTYDWNAEGSEWRLFYKFVHSRRQGRDGLFEVNPFFSYTWEGDERAMFQILGGLYYRRKRAGEWQSGGLWGLL